MSITVPPLTIPVFHTLVTVMRKTPTKIIPNAAKNSQHAAGNLDGLISVKDSGLDLQSKHHHRLGSKQSAQTARPQLRQMYEASRSPQTVHLASIHLTK
jgi:hypothetical protein